jgi:hypothetical protein
MPCAAMIKSVPAHTEKTSAADPDPNGSALIFVGWIRIRFWIQEG